MGKLNGTKIATPVSVVIIQDVIRMSCLPNILSDTVLYGKRSREEHFCGREVGQRHEWARDVVVGWLNTLDNPLGGCAIAQRIKTTITIGDGNVFLCRIILNNEVCLARMTEVGISRLIG